MNSKKCLKCGHVASFEGAVPLACPGCGAIYAKVEAAAAQGAAPVRPAAPKENPYVAPVAMRTAASTAKPGRSGGKAVADNDIAGFAARMRAESLYPTWRTLVNWATFFWYAVAVIGFLGTAISTGFEAAPTLGAMAAAIFIVLMFKALKETSLMLTDLADAAVRIAARADTMEHDAK